MSAESGKKRGEEDGITSSAGAHAFRCSALPLWNTRFSFSNMDNRFFLTVTLDSTEGTVAGRDVCRSREGEGAESVGAACCSATVSETTDVSAALSGLGLWFSVPSYTSELGMPARDSVTASNCAGVCVEGPLGCSEVVGSAVRMPDERGRPLVASLTGTMVIGTTGAAPLGSGGRVASGTDTISSGGGKGLRGT